MNFKGICKVEIYLNGIRVVSICCDKDVYKPENNDLLINKQIFIEFIKGIIYGYYLEEYWELVEHAVRGSNKSFEASKEALAEIYKYMEYWDRTIIIKGNQYLLDKYRNSIKYAQTNLQRYQIVFQ